MLRAYFDLSEQQKGASPLPNSALGGFLFRPDKWEVFEQEWQRLLAAKPVRCFHMTDFEGYHREFFGWCETCRRPFLESLLDLMCSTIEFGIGAGVVTSAYEMLSERKKAVTGNMYVFCGQVAVGALLAFVGSALASDEKVECVFEKGDQGAGQLVEAFQKAIKKRPEMDSRFAWSFANKCDVGALQAADIWAFELAKQSPRTKGADPRKVRYPYARITECIKHDVSLYDDAEFEQMFSLWPKE